MAGMQRVAILGSTGSVGVNTLDVIARHPRRFQVIALTARSQVDTLFAQCRQHWPRYAVMVDAAAAEQLARQLRQAGLETEVLCGLDALEHVASHADVDTVMAAIVGIAGLRPTVAAARAGKTILLANKESLVTAGQVFMDAVRQGGAVLLPIDSEHNAVFQALPAGYSGKPEHAGIRRILLTASGGPFRSTPLKDLGSVTAAAACAHPNWVMGRKISVDSATMMNKGLEVIEACWLFHASPAQIEVVVHPESVIHSLVEYIDGSVIAQLGNPDMRTPIAHALAYPERIAAGVDFLDLARVRALHFEAPDSTRFPCLRLAYEALKTGGAAPTVLNAANEVAVARFLEGALSFTQIPALIEAVLGQLGSMAPAADLQEVLRIDREARDAAERWLGSAPRATGTHGSYGRTTRTLAG
jgi:1-deoxy-D-xylulose-5-phosphate reductoisomerase